MNQHADTVEAGPAAASLSTSSSALSALLLGSLSSALGTLRKALFSGGLQLLHLAEHQRNQDDPELAIERQQQLAEQEQELAEQNLNDFAGAATLNHHHNHRHHSSSSSSSSSSKSSSSPPKRKMVKTFQAYLPNCHRTYSCVHCRAHLANHDELISKSFQGSQGRAYLFNSV